MHDETGVRSREKVELAKTRNNDLCVYIFVIRTHRKSKKISGDL